MVCCTRCGDVLTDMADDIDHSIFLRNLVSLIQEGKPLPQDDLARVNEFLTHFQAKSDLFNIGIAMQQMQRVSTLAQRIGDVELALFGQEGEGLSLLLPAERIALLRVLQKDFRDSSDFLTERSGKPTISSSDTLKQVPEKSTSEEPTRPRLPADSREKVRGFLARMLARTEAMEVEAEVVTVPAKTGQKPAKKKPKRKKP